MPQSKASTVDDWAPVPSTEGADDWAPVPDGAPKPQKQGFKRSLRSGMGLKPEGGFMDDVSQIGQGFKQMATHPIDSLSDLITSSYQGQEDVAQKGITRMKGPRLMDKIEGGAQYLESGIPFAGPVLSRAGEQTEAGDYAGAAGTMIPLAAGRPTETAFRAGRSTLASVIEAGPEAGGAMAGYMAGGEHPYMGAYVGRELGRRFQGPATKLADIIRPDTRSSEFRTRIGGEWVPEEPKAGPASEATQTLRGNKTLFDAPGATSSAPGAAGGARGPEGPLAKPRFSARETSEYLKSKGRSAGRLSEDIDTADTAADVGTRTEENLSPYMQRKIGEAEGRHDAGKMAATGAVTGEDSRVANIERRVNPGLRAATGPDPVRQSLVREAQRVIDDPASTARDKRIARDQISDIQAHPFEGAKGQDFVKEARSGKPKMTREEAEAATNKRSEGRKSRLAEQMGKEGARTKGVEGGTGKGGPNEPRLADLIKGSVEEQLRYKRHPADPVSGGPLHNMLEGIPKPTMPHQELMVKYGLQPDNEGQLFWSKGPGKEVAPNVQHIQFGVSGKWQAVGKTRSGEVRPIATGMDTASLEKVLRDGIPRSKAKDIFR